MNETQSTNVNSHIKMATNESLVKDPLLAVACTEEIVDNNQGFHAFSTPVKGVEEMVPDISSLLAPPSPPPLSTSGMGYSADYQPLSSYASSWKAQRLPSQQKVPNITSRQPIMRASIIRASMGNGIPDGDQVASPLPAHSPQLDGQVLVKE
ncbi:hypothetical protein RHSIM_Rhsim11G0014300 [Rhododendron simsii]|uniref:Uncharacterized protein n=1 Tax=Rhododendron simsii TaxID=118357 RepID=A0A834GAW4_RHOSS|nr:hypothetical protein RHSIM_Rhsim11G0014300 [Rhododendron simsii]